MAAGETTIFGAICATIVIVLLLLIHKQKKAAKGKSGCVMR